MLHALCYELHDVNISLQHHVYSPDTGRRYLLDAYLPDLNLAIEIDERHHAYQEDADRERERDIKNQLNCNLERIDVYGQPVFSQVRALAVHIRQMLAKETIPPYQREAPEEKFNGISGEYAAAMVNELERAGAFTFMEDFSQEVKDIGYSVKFGAINGIPSTANGEAGFIIELNKLRFTLSRRKTPSLRLLIADKETSYIMISLGFAIRGHQRKDGKYRYYSLPDEKHRLDTEEAIELLRRIKQRHDKKL